MKKELAKKLKIIAVVGPTSSGKSALAIKIAKAVGGEIISVDSRQVYKGLNIGSGKVTYIEMSGVPHHLLDVVSPKQIFTVSDFVRLGRKAIAEIESRGKVPILCGGTGLYLDSLLGKMSIPEVPPNHKLRKSLENKSATKLFELVLKLDPRRAKTIDRHNPVRLMRAIEIAKALGQVPLRRADTNLPYQVLTIGILWSDTQLEKRIHDRLLSRFKSGMITEVKKLHREGLSWKRMEALGLEYRYISRYLRNIISKAEMIDQLEREIVRYAKRQYTWFKRDKEIIWLALNKLQSATSLTKKFLQ